jgi:DNA-binding PucR family transcriptional regulator
MGAQRCGIARVQRPLSVIATVATRWVWIPGAAPDVDQLDKAIDGIRGIRVAIGSTDHGIEGFRRTHFDALATQRLLARLRSGSALPASRPSNWCRS